MKPTPKDTTPGGASITVSMSEAGYNRLEQLKGHGHFAELVDAYRFAVALALAYGAAPAERVRGKRQTLANVGTLDRDRTLAAAIEALVGDSEDPYRVSERLAEWGAVELEHLVEEHGGIPAALVQEKIQLHAGEASAALAP